MAKPTDVERAFLEGAKYGYRLAASGNLLNLSALRVEKAFGEGN